MKNNKRKKLLFLASALAGVTVFAAVGTMDGALFANADNATTFEMLYGAGIRTSDPMGIRFKTKVDEDTYKEIKKGDLDLNVAIIPYTYYLEYQESGATQINTWLNENYPNAAITEMPADKMYAIQESGTTYYYSNLVMSNVRLGNYFREFVGVSYLVGTDSSYEEVSITASDNARSIMEVAVKAYQDPADYAKHGDFLKQTLDLGMYKAYGVTYNNTTKKYEYNGNTYEDYDALKNIVDLSQTTVELNDAEVAVGTTVQLKPTVKFADDKNYGQNLYATWSSSNTDVATIDENGVVTVKQEGVTTITVKVLGQFETNCTLTAEIKEKETVVVSEGIAFMAQGNAGQWAYNTGAATIDCSNAVFDVAGIEKVTCNEQEIEFSVSGSNLILTDAPAGDQTYFFETSDTIYKMGGCVYGLGISTVAELEAWRTSESKWYAVLLNDIDYSGATLTDGANVLGTLDGRGYKISNFTTKSSFINSLYAAESIIKNVYFYNVTQDCSAWAGAVDRGVLGQRNNGTIENVYLDVHTTNLSADHYGVVCFVMEAGSKIHNVVVEITSDSTKAHYAMLQDNALTAGESYGVVGSYVNTVTESTTEAAWGTSSGFHQQLDWMVAEEKNDELLSFTSPYWVINKTSNTITMQPSAKGTYKEKAVTVVVVEDTLMAQGTANGAYNVNNARATIEGADFSNVESVTIDGEVFTNYTASGNVITLNSIAGGDHAITIKTASHIYSANLCAYVNGISTAEWLNYWRLAYSNLKGYSVLLNDIDYAGATIDNGGWVMDAVLDGRGHKISNFTCKKFVESLENNDAVIKNVYFDNVTQDCSSWSGAVDSGIFSSWLIGKLENIYLNVKTTNMVGEHYGVLFFGTKDNAVARNIVVEIESTTTKHHYAYLQNNGIGAVVENVVGSYANSSTEGGNAEWGASGGFHQQLDWMVAEEKNDELLNFTSPYWVIDTAANAITMLPYKTNFVAVEGTVNVERPLGDETVNVVLTEQGVTGTVTSVMCDSVDAAYTVVDGTLTVNGVSNGIHVLTITTSDGVYFVGIKAKNAVVSSEPELESVELEELYYNEKGTLDLSIGEINAEDVVSVTCNGVEVSFGENGGALTVDAGANGTQYTYVITTGKTVYTLTALACDTAIFTADDFKAWVAAPSGYTLLANNVDLNGETVVGEGTMAGSFDGQGYGIYNLKTTATKGLFLYVGGTFKNVQFINYMQDCAGVAATRGLFGDNVWGTIENILIQGQIVNSNADHNGLIVKYTSSGTFKNIVAYIESNATDKYHYGLSSGGDGTPKASNVYFVSSNNIGVAFNYDNSVGTVENCAKYETEEEMTAAVDFSTWGFPWTTDQNGAPCMREIHIQKVVLGYDISAQITNGEVSIDLGNIGLGGVSVTKVTINGRNTDYSLENGVVTLTGITQDDYTIGFVTKWREYQANAFFYDVLPTEQLGSTFLAQNVNGNATIESLDGVTFSEIKNVTCDGQSIAFTISGNNLILTNAPCGDQTYTLMTSRNAYVVEGCVYDNGISTVDQLNYWRLAYSSYKGYSVLLNDIDYAGATIDNGGWVADATLDGRGYTISNFTCKKFVESLENNNTVIKNVYFDNVTQDCSSWTGAVDSGIFGSWLAGKLENIYLNVKTANVATEHYGVLFLGTKDNAVARNIVVEIESTTDKFHYAYLQNNGVGAVVEGVVGSYANSSTEGGNVAWGTSGGFHQQLDWMVAEEKNDELLNFTSPYWVIDAAANTITMLPLAESKPPVVEDGYLVKDGVSAYTIVTTDNPSVEEKMAVTELQALFKEATGVTLKSVIESNVTYSDDAKYISIGKTSLLAQAGIYPATTLGTQGYEIKTKGQNLFIIGEPQGTLYGVYELLNLTLNFEQYTKTVYTLNYVSDLELPDVDMIDVPDIEHRVAFSGVQFNDETSRQRMRTQHSGEVIMNKGNAHNMLQYIVPFDTYYSSNPTWFSSKTDSSDTYKTTQLCYTAGSYGSSNYNAMKAVAVANIKQIILENPQADMMSLTQMDVENMWCNCSGCQAVISQYGEESATQILFLNDVVSEIEAWLNNEQGGREVQFMMFAYYETQEAPTKGNLKLHEDVSVWIAPIKDNYMTGINASGNSLGAMLSDWKDNASHVAIWAYGVYFSEYLVPYNTFDYIDQLIDAGVDSSANYMWIQGNWNTTQNTGFDSLKAYLISKLMWDSTLDVNTLTDNYFNAVYGAAASTMKTVYTEMKAELASMSLSGNIYEAPCGFNDWDNNYLKTQLGRLETAISEIASLQSSDPTKYQLIYDAIVCESISFRYIYKENSLFGWGGNYDTDAWGTFEEDVTRLGFTMIRENETMESYLG